MMQSSISALFVWLSDPLSRCVSQMLIPISSLRTSASPGRPKVRHTDLPLQCNFQKETITRLQIFLYVQTPILARLPDCTQTVNFKPILVGKLYGQLSDLSFFNQVQIDPKVHTLVWPNGVDLDPATLHDWAQHKNELVERARQWELSTA